MQTITRYAGPVLLLSALVLFGGCSAESKKLRLLNHADAQYDAGDYDKAEVEYLNTLKVDPVNARAIGRLGMIYSAQGRTTRAIGYIMKGHELAPDDLDLRLRLGQLYQAAGKLEDARKEAEFILTRKPTDPEAPSLLAASMANPNEAEALRKRLLSLPAPAPAGAPVLVALASLELRLGHQAEADALLQKAKAADPKYPNTYSVLGAAQLMQKNVAQAAELFRQAATLSPPRSPRLLQYAQFKIRSGNLAEGKKMMQEITAKTPDYVPAWVSLAEITLMENKLDECTEMLGKALGRDPQNTEALIIQGRVHNLKGEYDKAITLFEKLAQSYPRMPVVQQELGRAYALKGDVNKALTSLNQAVTLAPNLSEAVVLLARLNNQKGDYNAAANLLRKLLSQSPDQPQAQLLLAETYRSQGKLDDALALYQQLEQAAPKNPQTPLLRGMILVQQGKAAEARVAFERAFELTPDSPAPLEQLVNLHLKDKTFQEAANRVEAEIAKNAKLAGFGQLLLAKIAMARDDKNAAETHLKKAIELRPDDDTAYFLLAGIYSRTNQQEKALTQLNEVIKREPKQATALLLASVIQDRQGNTTAARDGYEKLLALNPRSAVALNNLAYLYAEKLNDLEKAQDLAQKARQIMPDDPAGADTLGWILFKKHQYARALSLLQEASEKRATDGEIMVHLGLTQYMMGEEAAARDSFQRYQKLDPEAKSQNAGLVRDVLAVLAVDGGRTGPEVKAILDKALADRPDDPVALTRMATLQEKEGKPDQAIKTLENAYKANPANVNVLVNLARLSGSTKQSAKALDYAKAARKLAPDDAEVTQFLGRLAYQNGDYQWAFSLLQEAARKQQNSPDLLYDLALASYSVGRVTDAGTTMRSALDTAKTQSLVAFSHAEEARQFVEMLALAENPAEALKQSSRLEQVLKADPASVPALMAAGAAGEQRSAPDTARQNYEKALAQFPDFVPAKLRLAILGSSLATFDQKTYDWAMQARPANPTDALLAKVLGIQTYLKGDHARAATLLKESLSARDNDSATLYYLGLAQYRLKDAGAVKSLQRAIELGLKDEALAEARKAIADLKK